MDRNWANIRYYTKLMEDTQEGWVGLELSRDTGHQSERVARVTYWDAEGQFVFQMFVKEVPLNILEELIAEAKNSIHTR